MTSLNVNGNTENTCSVANMRFSTSESLITEGVKHLGKKTHGGILGTFIGHGPSDPEAMRTRYYISNPRQVTHNVCNYLRDLAYLYSTQVAYHETTMALPVGIFSPR